MNFNIEKGVKLEKVKRPTRDKFAQLPLEQMIVGDSIFIPFTFASKNSIGNYVSSFKKRTNTNFTTRMEKEGLRIFKLS
jgi:hypothetical protein